MGATVESVFTKAPRRQRGGGPPFGRASVNALRKGLYLNVAEAVTVKNDCLRKELTSDGIHLHTAECVEWRAYLKAHPVEKGL